LELPDETTTCSCAAGRAVLGGGIPEYHIAIWHGINLPLAIFTTLYTNPVTFFPLYLLALKIGIVLLNAVLPPTMLNGELSAEAFPPPPDFVWSAPIESFIALTQWGLGMGWPLLVGVLTLATLLSVTGYMITRLGWNLWVRWEVIQRQKRRSR
jgi:uncharacterized protein (DUF2062 family)